MNHFLLLSTLAIIAFCSCTKDEFGNCQISKIARADSVITEYSLDEEKRVMGYVVHVPGLDPIWHEHEYEGSSLRITKTTYGTGNSFASISYTYNGDKRNNVTYKDVNGDVTETWSFSYNSEDQVVKKEKFDGEGNLIEELSYKNYYNGLYHQIERTSYINGSEELTIQNIQYSPSAINPFHMVDPLNPDQPYYFADKTATSLPGDTTSFTITSNYWDPEGLPLDNGEHLIDEFRLGNGYMSNIQYLCNK